MQKIKTQSPLSHQQKPRRKMELLHSGIPRVLPECKFIAEDANAWDAMMLMAVYAYWGDNEKALTYLEKAFELKNPFLPWLELDPGTIQLRGDPRFKVIVEKMKLPE